MREIYEGLDILMKYDANAGFAAEHDQIWASGFEPKAMQKADRVALKKLGWFWEKENESWSHFC